MEIPQNGWRPGTVHGDGSQCELGCATQNSTAVFLALLQDARLRFCREHSLMALAAVQQSCWCRRREAAMFCSGWHLEINIAELAPRGGEAQGRSR